MMQPILADLRKKHQDTGLGHSATTDARTGPKAYLPESVFEFKPVPEGVEVVHEFVVHNRGDEPLAILKVKSG